MYKLAVFSSTASPHVFSAHKTFIPHVYQRYHTCNHSHRCLKIGLASIAPVRAAFSRTSFPLDSHSCSA